MIFRLRTIYLMVVLLLGISVQQSYGYIPSRQAKFITFSNVNSDEMTINWVRGNGQGSIVLVKAISAPSVTNIGEDETTGTPLTAYNSGSDWNGTGAHLAFASTTGSTVTITGLATNTIYHLMVLEYNVDASKWDVNNYTAVLNPRYKKTLEGTLTPPNVFGTIALTATTATVNWDYSVANDALLTEGYYIDVRVNAGAILPAYDLLDIGLPSSKRFYINSGMSAGVGYQWRLRPYDAQGRVGAATAWQTFSTLQVDPTVTITGASSSCGAYASLVATWQLGTSGGASYYPSPATGVWTTVSAPTGAGLPGITSSTAPGSSTGNIQVYKEGAYVFQFEIGVGEYYYSTTAGYTFRAPDPTIITSATTTCGTYFALSATTTGGCADETGTWSYSGPTGGTGSFTTTSGLNTVFNLTTPNPTFGPYTFRWTSAYQDLSDYAEKTVTFAEAATASVTNASVGTCGLSYTLDGNTPVTSGNGSWYKTSGPGNAAFSTGPTVNNAVVTVTQAGEYAFVWQVSNTCATVSANKYITFYAEPSTANAGTDDENCGLTYTLAATEPEVGEGVWTGPAGVNFSNSGTYNSNVTIPAFTGASTYHSFTWTVDNGTCNSNWNDVTITFFNAPVASVTTTAGGHCGLSIANLDGNDPALTVGTGSWSQVSGPSTAVFGNSSTWSSSVTVSQQGFYSFVWTVSNGSQCTPAMAGKQVTFYAEPDVANAGQDAENCGLTYSLLGNDPTAGTGTWSKVAGIGTPSFINANTWSSNVTIPEIITNEAHPYYNETYTFRWSIGNGNCTTDYNDVVVTFYTTPETASAGEDVDVECGLKDGVFAAAEPNVTGSWSLVNGPTGAIVNITDNSWFDSEFNVDLYGSYTFRWTTYNGTCDASSDYVVFNFFEAVTAEAGSNTAVCGNEYTLKATEQTAGTGTWTVPSGITLSSTSAYNAVATASEPGPYTFTWAVSNGSCDVDYSYVTVTFKQAPDAYAGTDGEVCINGLYSMTGTWNPPAETGTWSHTYTGVSINFVNVNAANSNVTIGTEGTYVFTWTSDNGTCTDTDLVSIKVYGNIEPIAGTDFAVCGTSATLAATTPSAGTGTWSGTGVIFGDVNSNESSASVETLGEYTMTWSVKNGPCDVQHDYVNVTFRPEIQAYAGAVGIGCTGEGNEYKMTATYASGETGTWSVSENNPDDVVFSDTYSPSSNVTFETPGTYNFTWTVSNGTCEDSDDVTITVYDPINIPLGAAISGDETPAGGTSNIQYSIPNYNDELTYSWWYTPTESSCSAVPQIYDGTENVVYLDYPLSACDGTLSVSLIDNCKKVSTYHLSIDVLNIPVITKAVLTNNSTLKVTTNLPIYTDCSSGAIVPSDFQLFFNKNGGTATGATITDIYVTSAPEYTFGISVTGTPNGCETIEIKPISNAVHSGSGLTCEAMLNDQTTGEIRLWNEKTIDAASAINKAAFARSATLAWTIPTGAKSLVVLNTTNVFNDPTNYSSYPGNASYGTASYDAGTGYVVYNGSDNAVDITGLTPETNYYVGIWTYTEDCGIENEYYNMTQTTSSFGTPRQATRLVFDTPPTKIANGTQFTIKVKATLDDGTTPAYPGCDEGIYVHGTPTIASGTIHYNEKEVTMNAVYSSSPNGDCAKEFTVTDDDISCNTYTLTSGTFTAAVSPAEPATHAKTLSFTDIQKEQITVSWAYNGDGTGRVLGVKKGATIPLSDFVDGADFSMVTISTTATFGVGKQLPSSSVNNPAWAVHRTAGSNAVIVKGLTNGTSYNFRVVEYKKPECDTDWSLSNFKNSGTGVLNPRSISTLAKLGSFNGVEIAYFDGKSYQLQVDLNWEAITEDGIAYYEIYRQDMYSDDMIKVGSSNVNVSAGAGSKYSVTDNKGLALGETYVYRLVAVDFNGQSSDLAETLVTVNDNVNSNINLTIGSVNPNPVKDVVRFDISTTQLSPVYIEIRNVEGKVIYTEERMVNGVSTVEYKMNVKAAGSYFITVTSGDEGAVTSFIYQP